MRIDPPVSVPIVASAMPAATLAADPPLEPPGDRLTSWGLRAGPNADSSLVVPNANSWRLVLPMMTAPASRSATITGASWRGDVPFAHAGRRGGRRAGDVDQILDGDRDAVKGAAIAPGGELAVGLARLLPRGVGHDENERVQPRVVFLDAAEARVGHLLPPSARARAGGVRTPRSSASRRSVRPVASSFQSASRNTSWRGRGASSSGLRSGSARRSASAIAAWSHESTVMQFPWSG